MLLFFVTGCKREQDEIRSEIEYTVCDNTMLPDELRDIIDERKDRVFKLAYIDTDNMYIAVGYGEKDRNNLCVMVEELYATDKAIYIETNLLTNGATPSDATTYGSSSMYPYVVVKCQKIDLPVLYDID